MQVIGGCPDGEEDALFRALLAATTAAFGSADGTSMGKELGIAQQATDRAAKPVATQQLQFALADAKHLFT